MALVSGLLRLVVAAAAAASPLAPSGVTAVSSLDSFRSIANPAGPTLNQLLGINDHGLIVGYDGSGANPMPPNTGFSLALPNGVTAFSSESYPGAAQTQVVAVTPTGNTAVFWVDAKGDNHGFIDWNGVFTTVDDPLAAGKVKTTQILGMNNAGVAVGVSNDASGTPHAFRNNQATGRFTTLTPPDATGAVASGVNAADQVTGFLTRGKTTAGFFVTSARYDELDVPGSTNTQAFGLNGRYEIVGSYADAAGKTQGFILTEPGVRAPLHTIDDPQGLGSTVLNGINDQGQIVGFYTSSANKTIGLLATP
jgi:hypothetical protein